MIEDAGISGAGAGQQLAAELVELLGAVRAGKVRTAALSSTLGLAVSRLL